MPALAWPPIAGYSCNGGWGWADVSDTHHGSVLSLFDGDTPLNGWTVGGGLDYPLTDNLIGRIEYRHYEFDTKNSLPNIGHLDTDLDTVSAGVSIKSMIDCANPPFAAGGGSSGFGPRLTV